MDRWIKRMIQAAIESFPICEKKKAELLQAIMRRKNDGGDRDVLQ